MKKTLCLGIESTCDDNERISVPRAPILGASGGARREVPSGGLLCLGIESTCDETAAAVVSSDKRILSHIIYSQIPEHRKFGGVVPELAARAHILAIDQVINQALVDAGKTITDIDVVAAAGGPGLIGGVLVGWNAARGLAQASGKPLVAVNHMEGHALVPRLTADIKFPYLLLLVSGGNCQILLAKGVGDYEIMGRTIDDSIGEAFDKVAKMLGLPYPGGPEIDRLAQTARNQPHAVTPAKAGVHCSNLSPQATQFHFPRPLVGTPGCDFSFSGIKTSARMQLDKIGRPLTDDERAAFASEFQTAAIDCLIDRLKNAFAILKNNSPLAGVRTETENMTKCHVFPSEQNPRIFDSVDSSNGDFVAGGGTKPTALVVAGGVAKNSLLREALPKIAAENGVEFHAPRLDLCTDNGAMIAWAGIENFQIGNLAPADFRPSPRWQLA
ncbi:MAG: tRNA (adenosine(37)-N6)-threonylcarbamoyltransferase complex transferase subunit TsaD [Rickettsiales bacterium]|jgi:N6-L-threonylcarbamoyladenine synthase|nr:tRNA (adenosine(37)-N6)-threonylcarbamoyltransferase complex transferase subunit TsaD [Rickettsiales bacterium]